MRVILSTTLISFLIFGLLGCAELKKLETDLKSIISQNKNKTSEEKNTASKKTHELSPPIKSSVNSSGCKTTAQILNRIPDMSQGKDCQMAPEEYQKAFDSAHRALDLEDWAALEESTETANKVSKESYGHDHFTVSAILTLQALNKIENADPEESVLILESIMKMRRSSALRLDENLKTTMSTGDYFTLHKGMLTQLAATDLYLSGHKKEARQFYNNPLMELSILNRYTLVDEIDPSIHEVDLFLASIQLSTYATIKFKDGKIDDAYDALLSTSKIDKTLLGRLGLIPEPQINSLTSEQLLVESTEKPAKELKEIILLNGKRKFKDAYSSSKKWISTYKNSSNKRKGVAYFVKANASKELKLDDVRDNYENALDYLDTGYGNGNFMSALVSYFLLSDKIKLDKQDDFKRGLMFRKKDAAPRIKLINEWRSQYSGKVPENRLFENMLLHQSAMLHFGAGIPTEDPELQPFLEGFTKMEHQMNSGDLNALMAMMKELPKMMGGNNVDMEKIDKIQYQYYNAALASNG